MLKFMVPFIYRNTDKADSRDNVNGTYIDHSFQKYINTAT